MKARDELLEVCDFPKTSQLCSHRLVNNQALKKESVEKLAVFCKGADYPAFVRQLIVQGLIKIEEQVVEIQCRPEDKAIVARLVCHFFTYHFSVSSSCS